MKVTTASFDVIACGDCVMVDGGCVTSATYSLILQRIPNNLPLKLLDKNLYLNKISIFKKSYYFLIILNQSLNKNVQYLILIKTSEQASRFLISTRNFQQVLSCIILMLRGLLNRYQRTEQESELLSKNQNIWRGMLHLKKRQIF